jgi:hypothetical protein
MPRPYPRGRRRRPGRHPSPASLLGRLHAARRRLLLQGRHAGREKCDFFNGIARRLVAVLGLCGLILGLGWLGPLGAILGLAGASSREPGSR